jgi:hypothetical protein
MYRLQVGVVQDLAWVQQLHAHFIVFVKLIDDFILVSELSLALAISWLSEVNYNL